LSAIRKWLIQNDYKGVYIESKIKRFRLFKKDPALKPGQKRR